MKTIQLSVLFLAIALFACNKENQDPGIKDIDIDVKSAKLIEADNEFGFDLFKGVYADTNTPENFMISPLSVSLALSMAYNGAETETKAQMEEAMRVKGFTRDELNTINQSLIEALTSADEKVVMEIANSIWYRNNYQIQQSFLDINKTFYNAEVKASDFGNHATIDLINSWVSDKTQTKIPTIIQEIPIEAVLYLINAIYFNGTWTKEFNPKNTQKFGFETGKGNFVATAMMGRKDSLNYFSNETFSAIELPYGRGNFNMFVMLPNEDKQVSDIINQMNPENWGQWQNALTFTNSVDIRLPKFKIEFDIKLNNILKAMGMELAFTTQADFSGINPARDLFISYVKHKTFVEVDEEGTEAAAVTIIGFEVTSIGPGENKWTYFHCTRPFLFAITEKETGAVLFMGKVGNPVE
jgi:serine protease inhibitor